MPLKNKLFASAVIVLAAIAGAGYHMADRYGLLRVRRVLGEYIPFFAPSRDQRLARSISLPGPLRYGVSVPGAMSDDFSGTWNTDWGTVELIQTGANASGTYNYQGGKLFGTVAGKVFTGVWREEPYRDERIDAGEVIFVLSDNGTVLSGVWRYGYHGPSCQEWDGVWSGRRAAADSVRGDGQKEER